MHMFFGSTKMYLVTRQILGGSDVNKDFPFKAKDKDETFKAKDKD